MCVHVSRRVSAGKKVWFVPTVTSEPAQQESTRATATIHSVTNKMLMMLVVAYGCSWWCGCTTTADDDHHQQMELSRNNTATAQNILEVATTVISDRDLETIMCMRESRANSKFKDLVETRMKINNILPRRF